MPEIDQSERFGPGHKWSDFGDTMTEPEVAGMLRCSLKQMRDRRRRRCDGDEAAGPPFSRVGRTILYRKAAVRAWLKGLETTDTLGEALAKRDEP